MNYIKFNPSISYNQNQADYLTSFLTKIDTITTSKGSIYDMSKANSPNLNGSLLYNHRFHKKGRTISINLNAGKSGTLSDEELDNITNMYSPFGTRVDTLYQAIRQDNNSSNRERFATKLGLFQVI
jgi:hypothetical protein